MKSLSSLLTVSLMLATGSVLAHEPIAPPTSTPTAPQAMGDGKMDMSHMTPADHEKMAMAHFAKLDTNNDGMLSKAEFAKLREMMGMQHGSMDQGKMDHSKMDMQHDKMDHSKMDMSQMTPADHEKMAMAQFAKLDTNNDGTLSKAEFAKIQEMMGMQHGSMGQGKMDHSKMDMQHDKMDHSKMDMPGMKSSDPQKMAAEEFAKLDKNKDGKLTKSEIPTQHPMHARFDMFDSNKDGSVSKDEFTKHHGM
jgi:Ca2+-binding EF-hand superfamily protein